MLHGLSFYLQPEGFLPTSAYSTHLTTEALQPQSCRVFASHQRLVSPDGNVQSSHPQCLEEGLT